MSHVARLLALALYALSVLVIRLDYERRHADERPNATVQAIVERDNVRYARITDEAGRSRWVVTGARLTPGERVRVRPRLTISDPR